MIGCNHNKRMIERRLTKEEFETGFNIICKENRKIILFGAGEIGKRAILRMDYLGLKENILCIADNNQDKIGSMIEGIEIRSKEEIAKQYAGATIIITIGNNEVAEQIKNDLMQLGFYDFLSRQVLLHRFQYDGHREKALVCHGDVYILRQVVVNVTERCTLKCKNCSELMPRFQAPKDADKHKVIESITRLANMVTYIQDVTLMGGEPLMNPEFSQICEAVGRLKNAGKVKFVSIVSNATLVPDKQLLQVMHEYGITIMFSDYGRLSVKMKECIEACEKANVQWRFAYAGGESEEKLQTWSEVGPLVDQHFSEEELKNKFANCNSVYDCNTLYKGGYYFCCFAPSLARLGITKKSADSFDLMREDVSFKELTEEYHRFMQNEKVMDACNYCNMFGCVPAAEQL